MSRLWRHLFVRWVLVAWTCAACGDADGVSAPDGAVDAATSDVDSGTQASGAGGTAGAAQDAAMGTGAAGTMAADFCAMGGTPVDHDDAFSEFEGAHRLLPLESPCTTGPVLLLPDRVYEVEVKTDPNGLRLEHSGGRPMELMDDGSYDSVCDKPGGFVELTLTAGRDDLDDSLWETLSLVTQDGAPKLLRIKGVDEASTARCTLMIEQ